MNETGASELELELELLALNVFRTFNTNNLVDF